MAVWVFRILQNLHEKGEKRWNYNRRSEKKNWGENLVISDINLIKKYENLKLCGTGANTKRHTTGKRGTIRNKPKTYVKI